MEAEAMNPFEQLAALQSDPMPDLGGGSAVVELADTRYQILAIW